jgi:peptidoglycan/xylan/chitin deacetylase (PgdA/CDA1 family)
MLSKIHTARTAAMYWLGLARGAALRGARILSIHGTPRSQATELQRQLRYLQRQFRVVSLGRMVEELENPLANADGMVALTFDDGLRSNVEVAYPLLHKLGLPATFFICPALIDQRRWLWTHETRCRLRWLEPEDRIRLMRRLRGPADSEAFVEWMKRLDIAARRAVEDALAKATRDLVRTWADHDDYDLADWDELHQLDPDLITVGSHTLTHPILTALEPAEMEAEIAESRRLIEERLQRPVEFFAYPNRDHNAAVRQSVRKHYRAAVSCAKKAMQPGVDLHLLPRLSLPHGSLRLALAMHRASPPLAAPALPAPQAT